MSEEYEIDSESTGTENQSVAPTEEPNKEVGQVDDSENIAADETNVDESTPDEPTEIEKAQAAFEKKINKSVWKQNEEKRRREAAEDRIKQLENKINTFEQEKKQIRIPPPPEPYDDNYEQKLQERETAIRKAAAYDAEQKYLADQRQREHQAAIQKANAEAAEKRKKVYDSAVKYGIDTDQLNTAEERLASFIPKNDAGAMLAGYILEHEQSPLIIKYLGDNVAEAEKVAGMNPISAAMYIQNTVMKNAEKLKPRLSKTPEPVKSPSGRGAPKSQNRFLEGVVME